MTVCLLFAVDATAITGNEWKRISKTHQDIYIMGVVDTCDFAGSPFADRVNCSMGMEYEQIGAIVRRFVQDNPKRDDTDMVTVISFPIAETCLSKNKSKGKGK